VSGAAGRFVGQSVARREDPRLLTGHGRYVDDVQLPGMLHAAFVRSHVAAGRIAHLDVTAARELPGVVAVLTAADLNDRAGTLQPTIQLHDPANAPLRPLAHLDVRFVGEPVAIVVARSRAVAEDGCDLVELDVDPAPAVVDADAALAPGAPLVHPERESNLAMELPVLLPQYDEARAAAAHVVRETFRQHRQTPSPMETRGIVAAANPATGELHCHLSSQNPHEAKLAIARVTGVAEHHVRVSAHDVGGGFGQKFLVQRDELVVALAAHVLGRTIKWIEDRRENLLASTHARTDRTTVELALDVDGNILGAFVDELEDAGAFPVGSTGGAASAVGAFFPGPYRIGALSWVARAAWTNTCPRGAYRGPWMMETTAREQMIDVAARAIGVDPLELRRRNVIRTDELPYTTPMGMTYSAITPAETLDQAAAAIDHDAFRIVQQQALSEGRLLGIGYSLYVEPCAMGAMDPLGTETANVRVQPDGTVLVALGSGSHGQGLETTMAQVVADELGIDIERVQVLQGDTDTAPYGRGTGGSGSAIIGANACRAAAAVVRERVVQIAAHLLEAAPADLELVDDTARVRGTPARALPWIEVARVVHHETAKLPPELRFGNLTAVESYTAPPVTFANACHVCTVEVDAATGVTRIDRYVVSEDCGRMINPMIVDGQIAGGVAQGIGGALYEHLVYDEDGNPLVTTFMDYLVPTAAEIPRIEILHIETPADNPGGHKGVGEGGAIGSPACVVNAVNDALALVGARLTDQPYGPRQVLGALEAAGR
jgi:carbon-monoxide dehydrogenase large subunit